jgi:alpha-glucosidase
MPWQSAADDLGFSAGEVVTAKPWLPVAPSHKALAADVQDAQADSLLNFYRQLLAWRKQQSALIDGDIHLLPSHPQLLAFERSNAVQRVLCVFNFSNEAAELVLPAGWAQGVVLEGSGLTGASLRDGAMACAPWGGAFITRT